MDSKENPVMVGIVLVFVGNWGTPFSYTVEHRMDMGLPRYLPAAGELFVRPIVKRDAFVRGMR